MKEKINYLKTLNKVYSFFILLFLIFAISNVFYVPSYSIRDLTRMIYFFFSAYMALIFALVIMINNLEIKMLELKEKKLALIRCK
jgi:di/tricarboxylate transporter